MDAEIGREREREMDRWTTGGLTRSAEGEIEGVIERANFVLPFLPPPPRNPGPKFS
jgi:hypothetical protein